MIGIFNEQQAAAPVTDAAAYRSAHTRALIVIALLGLGIALYFCSLVVNGLQVTGVLSPEAVLGEGSDAVSVGELITGLLLLVRGPLYVATIIAFLLWQHRAHSNLRPLGAGRLEFSPGWAVGYFFIPFLNLVRPYQAVRELWRWSQPADNGGGITGLSFTASTGAPLVGWWWGFWLASNGLSNVYGRMADEGNMQTPAAWVGLFSNALNIVAAALAIQLIRTIDRMQTERSRQLAISATTFEQPPPPPASFNA
jgi:hypothetical protein